MFKISTAFQILEVALLSRPRLPGLVRSGPQTKDAEASGGQEMVETLFENIKQRVLKRELLN